MATTTTQTQTGSKQPADAQQKIEAFRALFADAPELGKKALENVIAELKSQVSEPRAKVESAGRVGARLGQRSELTMSKSSTPWPSAISSGDKVSDFRRERPSRVALIRHRCPVTKSVLRGLVGAARRRSGTTSFAKPMCDRAAIVLAPSALALSARC